jgi:hypothetical protein
VSDDGHGAAIAGFAVVGITYLLVESIVTFLLLGVAFGAVAVIAVIGSIACYVYKHSIRTARGWTLFLGGTGTLLVLPFISCTSSSCTGTRRFMVRVASRASAACSRSPA